ncbi:hypothetical protein [Pseudomonas sp. NA-150]|uniref:hypothetical protein n=1 Tax=Pseudomonas sp. NA-150 TaxID=3367525 RepID=UPI0037C7A981
MASQEGKFISLEGIEKVLDSLSNLFLVVWDKSPFLGSFVIVMGMLLPFWIAFTWMIANKPERAIDKRIQGSRKAAKKRIKGNPGGKKR